MKAGFLWIYVAESQVPSPMIPSLGKTRTLDGQYELYTCCLAQQSTYIAQPVRYHVLVAVAEENILHTFLSLGNVS